MELSISEPTVCISIRDLVGFRCVHYTSLSCMLLFRPWSPYSLQLLLWLGAMFSNLPLHPFLLHRHQSALLIPPLLTLGLPVLAQAPCPLQPQCKRSFLHCTWDPFPEPRLLCPSLPNGYLPASRHSASFSFACNSFYLKRKLPGFYALHDHLISFFLHSQVFERVIHTNLSFSHLPLMNQPTVTWFLPPSHCHSD